MGKTSITIKTIRVRFFKGLKSFDISFTPSENFVLGANGAGKTTIMDSWTWLLFGKDSQGNSDSKFNIKTLDKDNNVIPRVEHIVEAVLLVEGKEVTLKRVLKEKWVKTRGELEATYTGNTTDYYWNNVPKSQKEYQEKINGIVDESVFKLLSNPTEFNNQHWETQRNLLITIAGEVNDLDVAKGNKAFTELLSKLSDKSLKEYQSELAAERKKLKDAIKDIPARIDEVSQGKPEAKDYESLRSERAQMEKELEAIQSKIDDVDKANRSINEEKSQIRNKIFDLTTSSGRIKLQVKQELESKQEDPFKKQREMKSDLDDHERAHARLERELIEVESDITTNKSACDGIENELTQLRKEFEAENTKQLVFGEDFNCPTCKRPLDQSDIDQKKKDMMSDFNEDKAKSLELINKKGIQLKEKLENLQKYGKELQAQFKTVQGHIKDSKGQLEQLQADYDAEVQKPKGEVQSIDTQLENALDFNKDYQSQIKEIRELEAKLENFKPKDAQEHIEERATIQKRLDEIKEDLREEEMIHQADARISELEILESDYAQQIANIEKMEFVAQEFTITKVGMLEERVNKMFSGGISWKLFTEQVNGAQVPTCQMLYNGVPFADINTAAKVNTGISVINVLSDFYGIRVPIFVDGRESVTTLEKTESQVINLVVNKNEKSLKVI